MIVNYRSKDPLFPRLRSQCRHQGSKSHPLDWIWCRLPKKKAWHVFRPAAAAIARWAVWQPLQQPWCRSRWPPASSLVALGREPRKRIVGPFNLGWRQCLGLNNKPRIVELSNSPLHSPNPVALNAAVILLVLSCKGLGSCSQTIWEKGLKHMNFQLNNIIFNSGNPIPFRHKFHMCAYHLASLLLEPLIEMDRAVEIYRESGNLKLKMWYQISKFETLQLFSGLHPPDLGPFSQLLCRPVSCRWQPQPARGVPGTENGISMSTL